MSKFIRIKNELPELLEAVCRHDDCPNWLSDEIWNAFNNRMNGTADTAAFFRYALTEADDEDCPICDRPMQGKYSHSECEKRKKVGKHAPLKLVSKSELLQ